MPRLYLAPGQYADERLPLPDALQQLTDALAAAAALPPPAAPPPPQNAQAGVACDMALATSTGTGTPTLPHERTCVVCWDAPREVCFVPLGLGLGLANPNPNPNPNPITLTLKVTLALALALTLALTQALPLTLTLTRCASCRAVTRSVAAAVPPRRAAPL